jgi:hypothetical protein
MRRHHPQLERNFLGRGRPKRFLDLRPIWRIQQLKTGATDVAMTHAAKGTDSATGDHGSTGDSARTQRVSAKTETKH